MALPSERSMPVITVTWSDLRRAWIVALPGGVEMAVRQAADVESLVARHACGSAIRWLNPGTQQSTRSHTAADAGGA
ncbi:MAG: hypothetical protein V4515_12285 [Chloroflexota bacterium]